jgi:uncharacterized protein (TIGR03000 family)
MIRKILSVSLVLLLVGTGLHLAAGTSEARPRGGVHVGGFGGAHVGGFRGGFHSPAFHHGFHSGARLGAFGDRYLYPRYSGYYGTWPYYGYYGSWPYTAGYGWPYYGTGAYYGIDTTSPYTYSYPTYPNYADPGSSGSDDMGGTAQIPRPDDRTKHDNNPRATSTLSTSPYNGPAVVSVTLPGDATLSAQGVTLSASGPYREFQTPTLKTGHRYAYDFQASWKANGRTVMQKQTVIVTAGAHVTVRFPAPAKDSATASR